jgi:transcriptional regulator with XRE-family HTH domain
VPKSIIALRLEALQEIEREVGKRVAELRANKGWSQDEFAHRAGLNRTHLYRLERGLQSMTLATLKVVADTLEVRVVELLKDL